MFKFLTNFNYIWFFFFHFEIKYKKTIFFNIFFFSWYFPKSNIALRKNGKNILSIIKLKMNMEKKIIVERQRVEKG